MFGKNNIIDEKDRKILVELDKNARQTDSEIAKKVRLSKQVINYRIQKIIKKGIITDFYTIINTGILGLNSYYVYLQLEKINKNKEKELLNNLRSLDYIGWLVSGMGRWDVVMLVYADSISTFDKLLNKITNLCGSNLHEYNFTSLIYSEHAGYKFLEGKNYLEGIKQTEKINLGEIDKIDKKILTEISQKARTSVVEISEKTKIPIHVVSYRIKKLIKEDIITGFKPKININKLGYQWHLLLLQFQKINEKRKQEFISFCNQHKKIYYITNCLGLYNAMLDVHVKNIEEFKEVLLELKENFSDIIKIYESMVIFDEYKINYFPVGLI